MHAPLTCHILVRLCTQAGVYVHGQAVKLRQGCQGAQQQDNNATALYRFNGPCQQVWCQRFKVLQQVASNKLEHCDCSAAFVSHVPGVSAEDNSFDPDI